MSEGGWGQRKEQKGQGCRTGQGRGEGWGEGMLGDPPRSQEGGKQVPGRREGRGRAKPSSGQGLPTDLPQRVQAALVLPEENVRVQTQHRGPVVISLLNVKTPDVPQYGPLEVPRCWAR